MGCTNFSSFIIYKIKGAVIFFYLKSMHAKHFINKLSVIQIARVQSFNDFKTFE